MIADKKGLPLPSVGSGTVPNTTIRPDPTGAGAQAGVSYGNMGGMNDFSKRLEELTNKLRYRLDNITSITQTAQQGAFNAFGNNFVTRGAMQGVGALKDVATTFLDRRSDDEKVKDDPVLAAALTYKEVKDHTPLLADIKEATRTTADLIMDLIEKDKSDDIIKGLNELAVIFEPPKEEKPLPEKEKVTRVKVDDIIDPIPDTEEIDRKVKDTVNVKAKVVPDKPPKPTAEEKRAKNREEVIDVETVEKTSAESIVDIEDIRPNDQNTPRLESNIPTIEPQEIKPVERNTLRLENSAKSEASDQTEEAEEKKNSQKILFLMTSMNKNMEKLVAGPLSDQEDILEANQKKPIPILGTDDKKDVKPEDKKDESWWEKLLGFGALRGVVGLLAKGLSTLMAAVTAAGGVIWALVKKLGGGAIDIAGDLLKGGGKAGGLLKGGAKVLKYAKAIGPQALIAGGLAAADGVAGMFGIGKDENGEDIKIDSEQDDKNWNKMSAMQKLESSLARGVEHGADFMFMGNIANHMKKKRIDAESDFFAKKEKEALDKALRSNVQSDNRQSLSPEEIRDTSRWMQTDKVGVIDNNEREIARMKQEAEAARDRSTKESMMQVVNSNVTNNSLIMPSRRYARNMDSSFNTYLKTSF